MATKKNPAMRRISFNLKEETQQELERLAKTTRIKKTELIKLMIEKNSHLASELNISARKNGQYTSYTNLFIPSEDYENLSNIANESEEESAKVGTVVRGIIEYSLWKKNFLPIF